MKTLVVTIIILLGSLASATAQDFYLPSSSKSKKAVKIMHEAAELFGNVHIAEGNAKIDQALALEPDLFLARVYAIQYASKDVKSTLIDKALAIDTKNFNEAEKIMRSLLENWQKDPKYNASEEMKALVTAYPNTPQALEWASLHAFYTEKNLEAGLDYAQKLAKMSANYAPNYNTMGYAYMQKKEMDKAKAALEKYIALAPKEPNAYDSMAEYYMNNEDYAKSAEYYDKAVAMGLDDAKARADKARSMIK